MALKIRDVEIHINFDVGKVSREIKGLRQLREGLIARAGGDSARVDRLLSERLLGVLERFGNLYVFEMSAHIDRIVSLRESLTKIYESVIRGESNDPEAIGKLYRELEAELAALKPPKEHAESVPKIEIPPGEIPPHEEVPPPLQPGMEPPTSPAMNVVHALGQDLPAVQKLAPKVRRALTAAARRFPLLVRKAIIAEGSGPVESLMKAMREAGKDRPEFTPEEITGAMEGVDALNLARSLDRLAAAQEAAGWSPAEIARERARIEALEPFERRPAADDANPARGPRAREAIAALGDPALQKAVGGSRLLARLAIESPSQLRDLWVAFGKKKSRGYPFWQYAFYISRIVRGLHGEFGAAFRLGKDFVLLKGPDFEVTLRGTDLVALSKTNGEVLLIDNKAFAGDIVAAVSSLVRNLPKNLGDDIASFENRLGEGVDTPPEVFDAMTRLSRASREINQLTANMTKQQVEAKPVQAAIDGILRENNIRRVVTNAGGNVAGLTSALEALGLDLIDLNSSTDPG